MDIVLVHTKGENILANNLQCREDIFLKIDIDFAIHYLFFLSNISKTSNKKQIKIDGLMEFEISLNYVIECMFCTISHQHAICILEYCML